MAIFDLTYNPPTGTQVVGMWQLGGFTTSRQINPGMFYADNDGGIGFPGLSNEPTFYHTSPTTGAFPPSPSGNYTLTYTVTRTGLGSADQQLPSGATGLLENLPIVIGPSYLGAPGFRMGTAAQMQAAFGTDNFVINPATFFQLNDGVWVLTRPGTAMPARMTFEMADFAAETAFATTQATWNAGSGSASLTAIYQANGVLAVNNNELTGEFDGTIPAGSMWRIRRVGSTAAAEFHPLTLLQTGSNFRVIRVGTNADMIALFGTNQIQTGAGWILERQTATAGNAFTNVATWNAAGYPGGSTTTVFAYANTSLGLHYSCNVATSGTAPLTQPPAGTYRIRVSGGGSSAAQTGLTGPISNFRAQDGAANQCTIRIGTSSQWGTAFANVPSTGVIWHLERETASTVPGTPGQRGNTVGRALCHRGGVLSWELRSAIPALFDVLTYNNTTQAMGFRTAQ